MIVSRGVKVDIAAKGNSESYAKRPLGPADAIVGSLTQGKLIEQDF